jgi:hypothetical protein
MKMKMLHLFVLAAFFAAVAEASTALQTFCASLGTTKAAYNGTSCYVLRQTAYRYSVEKNSCQDILGYYGHLAFLKNSAVMSVLSYFMTVSFFCESL